MKKVSEINFLSTICVINLKFYFSDCGVQGISSVTTNYAGPDARLQVQHSRHHLRVHHQGQSCPLKGIFGIKVS